MTYFANFGTFHFLILQFLKLFNALFYRHRERLASGRCKQRSGNQEPRERSGNALFCILGLFVEAVEDVEHCVLRGDIAPCFGAALSVDGAAHVAELSEEVEGIEHDGETDLGEGAREAGVPHEFVGVHGVVVVAAARVHGHVGGELETERNLEHSAEAIVEVGDVDGAEVLAA